MKKRIVSLIASSTEMVYALGLQDQLVGRSHECDFPSSVKTLPQCTEPKFVVEGSSYEIDQRVKAILQEGLSVYRVFADQLKALKPDVILTQIQCEVCAVSQKDVEAAVCEFIESRPQIVSLNTNSLADLWEDLRKVAKVLEVPERGETLIQKLKARLDAIEERIKLKTNVPPLPNPPPPGGRGLSSITIPPPLPVLSEVEGTGGGQGEGDKGNPRVVFIEWIDPLMSCGNWMPELIEKAGGINLFGEAGKHSPWMSWEELVQKDPDVIFISPCGFDIPRTQQEMHLLTSKPEWKGLKAVQEKKVFIGDGNQFFNRPGPRLVESLEILAEIFHPDLFHFGHEKKGWERV